MHQQYFTMLNPVWVSDCPPCLCSLADLQDHCQGQEDKKALCVTRVSAWQPNMFYVLGFGPNSFTTHSGTKRENLDLIFAKVVNKKCVCPLVAGSSIGDKMFIHSVLQNWVFNFMTIHFILNTRVFALSSLLLFCSYCYENNYYESNRHHFAFANPNPASDCTLAPRRFQLHHGEIFISECAAFALKALVCALNAATLAASRLPWPIPSASHTSDARGG